jgi:hypothetical protein
MFENSNIGLSSSKLSGESCCTIKDNQLRLLRDVCLLGDNNPELGIPQLVDSVEDEDLAWTISLIFTLPDRGLHLGLNSTSCDIAFLFPALEDTEQVIMKTEFLFLTV